MTRKSPDIDSIIDDIYAGTMDDQAWHRAIVAIMNLVGGASASITGVNPRTRLAFRAEVHNLDPTLFDAYRGQWFDREIRLAPALHLPAGEPFFEARLMPSRDWRRSEIYNEFLCKVDLPWFLCFWLHKTPEKLSSFAIQGSRLRGPLDARDGERIQPFIPHLQRALAIRDQLDITQSRTRLLSMTVDKLPFGVIVLDAGGRILECSAAAGSLMTRDSGMRRAPDGALRLRGRAGIQLERWILGGAPPLDNPDGLLKVRGPQGSALSILAVPLPMSSPFWLAGDARWMLMVFDPLRAQVSRADLIAQDLCISAREAELTTLLVQGLDLRQIAARMRISVHTARTHLKAIFAKTGCGSQVELIRRVLSGPAALRNAAPNTPIG